MIRLPDRPNMTFTVDVKKNTTKTTTTVSKGAPIAQWVKRWPTDLAVRVRSLLEAKSSRPLHTALHYYPPIVLIWMEYSGKGRKIASHLSIHYHSFSKMQDESDMGGYASFLAGVMTCDRPRKWRKNSFPRSYLRLDLELRSSVD